MTSSTNIGRAASAAKGVGRSMEQSKDVDRAKDTLETYQQRLQELQEEFDQEAAELKAKIDPQNEVLDTVTIRPKKVDIDVQMVALLWQPYWQDDRGQTTQAW